MTKEKEYDYSQMLYEAMRSRIYTRKKEIIYFRNKYDEDEHFSLYATDDDFKKARKKFRENGE